MMVKLTGVKANRDGMGAMVRAGKQWAIVQTSGSYLSASDPRVHFGLGRASEVEIEVIWPGGGRQAVGTVKANQVLKVREAQ